MKRYIFSIMLFLLPCGVESAGRAVIMSPPVTGVPVERPADRGGTADQLVAPEGAMDLQAERGGSSDQPVDQAGAADQLNDGGLAAGQVCRMPPSGREIRIMWYNVENLFHPSDDSLPGDDEFTPGGARHWTWYRYRNKLTALAKVIIAGGEWEPPALVGLGEIENDSVLDDLVNHPILRSCGYRYLHRESPDHRGMDVALLYREERFRVITWKVHKSPTGDRFSATRDMMHVSGRWGRGDTLDLLLVHLISRYSGTGATAGYRYRQAQQLARLADSVRLKRRHPLVLLAGDFNEEPGGYSLQPLREVSPGRDSIREILPAGKGSYKYRGVWEKIDRFMVAGEEHWYRFSGKVLELPALLVPDESYGGDRPDRTYVGYRYRGGVSDHLPIVITIRRRLVPGGSGL
ncbi:MAG: endonuclease/exonuclease/phosphatase family protein [Bacteroidota bacterium]